MFLVIRVGQQGYRMFRSQERVHYTSVLLLCQELFHNFVKFLYKVVRERIELSFTAYETVVLPLNYLTAFISNLLIINVVGWQGAAPCKIQSPKLARSLARSHPKLVLPSLGEHLGLYTSLGKLYISIVPTTPNEMLLLSLCYLFMRRCTRSSPWIHTYYLRTCISLTKLDNANHELLITIVLPIQVRT